MLLAIYGPGLFVFEIVFINALVKTIKLHFKKGKAKQLNSQYFNSPEQVLSEACSYQFWEQFQTQRSSSSLGLDHVTRFKVI